MTSAIQIDFRTAKDFDVHIDNIEQISPRGMELAFNDVEKKFLGMKGVNLTAARVRDAEVAETKKKEAADEVEKKLLFDAEIATFTSKALDAAEKKFDEAPAVEKARLAEAVKAEDAKVQKKQFLDGLQTRLADAKLANSEADPEATAESVVNGLGDDGELEKLDAEIEETQAAIVEETQIACN